MNLTLLPPPDMLINIKTVGYEEYTENQSPANWEEIKNRHFILN